MGRVFPFTIKHKSRERSFLSLFITIHRKFKKVDQQDILSPSRPVSHYL